MAGMFSMLNQYMQGEAGQPTGTSGMSKDSSGKGRIVPNPLLPSKIRRTERLKNHL